jgi:hypothetical protein
VTPNKFRVICTPKVRDAELPLKPTDYPTGRFLYAADDASHAERLFRGEFPNATAEHFAVAVEPYVAV